jgi:transcriptional regulator with XRE-family HTH domain
MGKQALAYPDLGAFLRDTGKTQQDIAAAAGVSQAAISRYLHERREMKLSIALRIAAFANIPIESLIDLRPPAKKRRRRAA